MSITKTPFTKDSCYVDFVNQLDAGETITISSVTATDLRDGTDQTSAIVAASPAPAVSQSQVIFWYQGGVIGEKYLVSAKVVTSKGRDLEGSVEIIVVEFEGS